MTVETRFVRPPDRVLEELVRRTVPDPTAPRTWVESGSASLVLLTGGTAVRIARDPARSADLLRSQAVVDALPALPFAVPRSRGTAVEAAGVVAVPTERLEGAPHPAGSGDVPVLRALLAAIGDVDPEPLRPLLAPPRSFMGGDAWEAVLRWRVVPRLPERLRSTAIARIDALAATAPGRPTLCHGDLAGSNVLWRHGQVSGVLDWDLASVDDPAEDVASLAGWHGLPAGSLTDPESAARADAIAGTCPLQIVAFALLQGRGGDEVERAVARAERRLAG